jgi:hypothetical protein
MGVDGQTTTWPLYLQLSTPLSIAEEVEWASGPVWMDVEKKTTSYRTRFRTPDHPSVTNYTILAPWKEFTGIFVYLILLAFNY